MRTALLCSAVIVCLSMNAFAQERGDFRVFGGVNSSGSNGLKANVGPSFGFDVGLTVAPALQLTGGYSYGETNKFLPCYSCAETRDAFHEVLGGVRLAPTKRNTMPYIGVGLGVVDYRSAYAGSSASFAYSVAGGVNIGFTKKAGLMLDLRAVKARDLVWYARFSAGVFFRFGDPR